MKRPCSIVIALLFVLCLASARAACAGELIVSAAASLTDAFSDIEPAFEKQHPGVDVIMNFASSGALYRQIEQGAPADVYASANPKWMNRAVENGFATLSDIVIFARNSLVLAVPVDNPARVEAVDDLLTTSVKTIGIGTPETVPAGQYAKSALEMQGLYAKLTQKLIFAESVRQVLDYLTRGEVDCGFVYRTDAVKAGSAVRMLEEIPLKKPVTYPIAALKDASNPALAREFVDFVRSAAGEHLLEARGFKRP